MTPALIGPDIAPHLNWLDLLDTFAAGHKMPKARIADTFLYRDRDTLLSRAAWIDGLGSLVKTATIYPDNALQGIPNVNGAVSLFSDSTGTLAAMIDFHLVTRWKTAADSLFAASKLARPNSRRILLIGAGAVARSMHSAYSAVFPDADFTIWNRTAPAAIAMAQDLPRCTPAPDLQRAVEQADIICTATMSKTPVLKGDWLRPGQHVDLIGAFRPDMREADDTALRRATIFVDSFDTTLDHIGELKIPLAQGVITRDDIRADFYKSDSDEFQRPSEKAITICKNGGGAHLDLMTSAYILKVWQDIAQ